MKTIVLLSLIAISLSGCGGEEFTPGEFERALELCAPHGGLEYYYKHTYLLSSAYCNENVRIISNFNE